MNDTRHECDCDGECCEQYTEEDWDDEQPIPEVRSQPPRQASAKIMSLAGQALQDPDRARVLRQQGRQLQGHYPRQLPRERWQARRG